MSNLNKPLRLLLALLALHGCQTAPVPAPAPQPQVQAVEVAPPIETEAVDFNQQLYQQGIASLKAGNTDVAIELLLKVSVDAPRKPFVFTNLALAYFKLGKFDLAGQALQQAIDSNDKDAIAHNHLGILQRQRGEFEQARQSYQRAIQIDRNYAAAHLNLGILFDIYLQDLQKALQQYQQYQDLTQQQNEQVAGWITDIQRRIKPATSNSQG